MAVKKDTRIIQSLDKGLYLLEVIEQAGKPLTLGELWGKLRWDKATIHRLLATLERRGYVLRDQATRQYRLGLKIYGLYNSLQRNLDIQRVTRPYLAELASRSGESAHLAVVVERSVVFIDRVSSSETLSVNTQIGAREPLYCTALGKAYLAFQRDADLERLCPEPLQAYTRRTVTSLEGLRKELQQSYRQGYAVDDEEYIDGIRCVAAPILNEFGIPVAVMGISGPKHRLPEEAIVRHGTLIRELATAVSRFCGYQGAREVKP
jgi:DNA-binding IclR family transcriptional regulator